MKYGVFDHMDRWSQPLTLQYEMRLRLIEAYDRGGFHAYHLAEHHSTPLGMAPAPSVFLAAVAQRTKRLRFGPLVYTLSIHHPLRAFEELCMLDHMSGGRLELGIGRGISPIELGYYGIDPSQAQSIYLEASSIILQAFSQGTLNYQGKHFRFDNVPIEMTPLQRPRPPLWCGLGNPDGTVWAAQNKVNMVCNGPNKHVRTMTDRYREEWAKAGGSLADLPFAGMSRHIVVADTEAEAIKIARPAYEHWYGSFIHLWDKNNMKPGNASYPAKFDDAHRAGLCIVGAPETVRDVISTQISETGINYLLCRLAFGDLPYECSERSVDLLVNEIMPQVQRAEAA